MKLKISTETDIEKYVIGESPLENMIKAIALEYDSGIHPLVVKEQNELKHKAMERYGSIMLIYAMNRSGKGEMKLCPDECRADLYFSTPEHPNLYLGIQVKTTSGPIFEKNLKIWKFSDTDKKYSGLLMYLRSLKDGESWLIPYEILNFFYNGSSLRISNSNASKRINWNLYKVKDKDVATLIYNYYIETLNNKTNLVLESLIKIITPSSLNIQKEHITRANLMPILLKT